MTDEDLTRLLALDGAPGPALALDAADTNALVERALDGAGFGPAGGGGHGGGGHGGPGHAGPAGGASAAVRGGLAAGTKLAIGALVIAVVVVIAVLVLRRSHGAHVAAAPIDAATDAPPDATAGGSTLDATAADSSGDEVGSADDADVELDPEPAHPHKPRPVETRAAADLLGEANAKRAARQWRESDALYMRVVRRAPRSLAALARSLLPEPPFPSDRGL